MPQKQIDDFEINLSGEDSDDLNMEKDKRGWWRRKHQGITTTTAEKRDAPDGLWTKCPNCKYTCTVMELKEQLYVCPKCQYHHRIGSDEYFEILFDNNEYTRLFDNIKSKDFLGFTDLKPYHKRLEEAYAKTGLHDSMSVAAGKLKGFDFVIAC